MTAFGDPHDPLDHVIVQAEIDAVRAAAADPLAHDRVAAVLDWLAAEHGPQAVRDLTVATIFDLAEALGAIGSVEGRPTDAVIDRWFREVPPPEL